jgi:hypothetical protein
MPTQYDRNRYKKTYPFVRREVRRLTSVQSITAAFLDTDSVTVSFTTAYATAPVVTATATGSGANVNVYVESVGTTSAVIRTSAIFTGNVYVQVSPVG